MVEVVLVVHHLTGEVAETETVEQAEMADAAEQPILETASLAQTVHVAVTVLTVEDLACTAPATKPLFLTRVSS